MEEYNLYHYKLKHYLAIFAESQCLTFDIQNTRDVVALSEVWQYDILFPVVIQVAAVCPVEPHLSSRPVTVVSDGPPRHANTGPLVAAVLFDDHKLHKI